ncbi:MAG: T9SS type A sorting domain-containing protein, partial [Candidatus Zixiibacteriota bacterium]
VRPASPEFDWRLPGSRSQWIKIDNLSRQTVTVRFAVEWARLVVEPSLLTLGEFESDSTLMTLRNSPNSTAAEPFSVFIYNNRGWAPLLVGALALPDFQTSVGDDDPTLPASFSLSDVYPNPSRGTSHLRLNSPVSRRFTVVVFNVLGQALQSQQVQVLGETEIMVELESTSEFPLAAGIYFIRVSSDSESLMRKFVLVK